MAAALLECGLQKVWRSSKCTAIRSSILNAREVMAHRRLLTSVCHRPCVWGIGISHTDVEVYRSTLYVRVCVCVQCLTTAGSSNCSINPRSRTSLYPKLSVSISLSCPFTDYGSLILHTDNAPCYRNTHVSSLALATILLLGFC